MTENLLYFFISNYKVPVSLEHHVTIVAERTLLCKSHRWPFKHVIYFAGDISEEGVSQNKWKKKRYRQKDQAKLTPSDKQ